MGSSRQRNSTRAEKPPAATRTSPHKRSSPHRSPLASRPLAKSIAVPAAVEWAIDDQRDALSAAMSVLYCLHSVLRRQTADAGPEESDAMKDAAAWVDLANVTAMLLVQLHSVHFGLDSTTLREAVSSAHKAESEAYELAAERPPRSLRLALASFATEGLQR